MADENNLESASAISPRMSICLKASNKDIIALIAEIEDDNFSLENTDNNVSNTNDTSSTCTTPRSTLSALSILLTGTRFSILSSSTTSSQKLGVLDENEKNNEKRRRGKRPNTNTVRFSERVHFRNYLHVTEITSEERTVAWFCSSEYRTIFRNNMRIIHSLGKRDKELKKIIAKKKKEEQKLKKKSKKKNKQNNLNENPNGSSSDFEHCDDESEHHSEHIIGINRDEEQGYSVRGLENETQKKVKKRDQVCMQAKYTVLSLQADLDTHIQSMQEEYDRQMKQIAEGYKTKKKKNERRNKSLGGSSTRHEQEEIEKEEKENRDFAATNKLNFGRYVQTQHNQMMDVIATRYADICKQHAKDALEVGLQDERTARAIDWVEASSQRNLENSSASAAFLLNKGIAVDTISLSEDRRRPSATSTTETEESVTLSSSMKSIDEVRDNASIENNKDSFTNGYSSLSRMKRAKRFLRKLTL